MRREFFLQNNSIHQEDNTFRPLAISLCYHRTPRPLDELSRDGWVVAKHQAVTRFIGPSLDIYLSVICYDMEVGENRMRVFYGTEKREGERLEIYGRDVSPCSSHRVSDL